MDSATLIAALTGGDAPKNPVSGLAPAPLSGLNFGDGDMSGTGTDSLTGSANVGGGRGAGMMPGMDLNQLSQMLAQAGGGGEGTGPGTGAGLFDPIGGGVSGGFTGGFGGGTGTASPTAPGGGAGYGTAGQTGGSSVDPLSIIQKLLGLGSKLAQTKGSPTASPTAPGTGGYGEITPTGAERTAFTTGIASPTAPADDLMQSGLFQGGLGGYGAGLSDPTLGGLYTSGLLQGMSGDINANALQDLLAGNTGQFSLTGGEGNYAPGGSAEFSLGGNTQLDTSLGGQAGPTNWGGAAAGGVGSLLGLLNLYQSGQSGNIPGAIGGGLGTAQGLAQLLQSSPQLAQALGISPSALSGTGAGLGGLSALLGLGTGVSQLAEGNALGAIPTVQGAFAGLAATPAIYSMLSGITPQAIAAGQSALGAAGPALSSLGTYSGGVLMAAQALYDSLSEMEQTSKLRSGAYNNPIAGKLYSNATEGVANANDILSRLGTAGGAQGLPTESLLQSLGPLSNSLLPYFQTGQGGVGAIRASDAAGSPGTQSKDQYTQNFTSAKTGMEGVVQELLNRGMTYQQLGQIPGINPAWSSMSLDAGGQPWEYYARGKGDYAKTMPGFSELLKSPQIITRGQNVDPTAANYEAKTSWDDPDRYQPEYSIAAPEGLLPNEQGFSPHAGSFSYTPWAYAGAGTNGSPLQTGAFTPDNAFLAAMGSAGYDPNAMTPEEQAKGKMGQPDLAAMQGVASMYGGPLWMALARMGSNQFAPMIQQNFNPWATWSQMSPDQRLQAMGPSVLGPMQMNKDAGIYGGSWGQVENPRVADFFSGYTPAPLG